MVVTTKVCVEIMRCVYWIFVIVRDSCKLNVFLGLKVSFNFGMMIEIGFKVNVSM